MDGLSAAASVVAIVQITGTIVSMTYNYGKDCWDAKDDSKRLLVEAKALHNVMEAAAALVNDDSVAKRFPNLEMLLIKDPDGLLEVCQEEVTSVDKALRKAWNAWCDDHHTVRGLAQLAKWPLKKKRLENALEGIRSLHEAANQALALDTGRDVANIHTAIGRLEDNMSNLASIVEDIKHMTVSTSDVTTAVLDSTTRIEGIAIDLRQEQEQETARAEKERERMRAAEAKQRAQARQKEIIRRLEPKDQARASLYAKHSGLCNGRDRGTSRWLLDGEPLSTVLQPEKSPRTLWIKGKAGCGKSMLASAVIEHAKTKDAVLAFFYFDFNNSAASKSETMLRSLAAQLVGACETLPAAVTQFAAVHLDTDGKVPPIGDIVQLLRDLVGDFTGNGNARPVVLVLDALDECADRAALLRNLDSIRGWDVPLSIILTSHDLPDIAERLGAGANGPGALIWRQVHYGRLNTTQPNTTGTNEAAASATTLVVAADSKETASDIDIFVQNQLETDDDFTKWSPTAKKKITAALVSGAGGMFRWVACQLEMLRDCVTEGDLDRALASLPPSLSATYTAALQRVKAANRPRVLRLLFWILVARWPPLLEEDSDFLAVDLTDPTAGPDGECHFKAPERIARLHDITLFCPTLIRPAKVYDWREKEKTLLLLAHSTVKEYLERPNDLLAAFGPDLTATFSTALSKPPALHPANILGVAHNHACKTLLGYVGSWRQPVRDQNSGLFEGDFERKWPMYKAAANWDIHFHSSCAAESDDAELHDMVFSLYRVPSGKSVNVFANYSFARHLLAMPSRESYTRMAQASSDGLEEVIKRLLEESARNGTADRDKSIRFDDCVVAAVRSNHVGVLSLLLKSISSLADLGPVGSLLKRASRGARGPEAFRELLHFLSETGQLSTSDLDDCLLRDDERDDLQSFEVFSLLVDAGARPDSSVLLRIIKNGEHALLKYGLPMVEDKELQETTVLCRSQMFDGAYRNDENDALVLTLLATRLPGRVFVGVASSERCRRLVGSTLCPPENTFAVACMQGQAALARQMIENGAVDTNAPLWTVTGWGAYPLFVAVFALQLEIVAACLAAGAQVDQRGSTTSLYRPLSLAIFAKDVALVRLLVEHGAALDTVCSEYGTPLQTATFVGHEQTVEFLLTRPGVAVGQTAAPKSPPWEIVHQYAYWTPLRIAANMRNKGVVALLLRHGPDGLWAECPSDVYSGADEVSASSWEVPRPLLAETLRQFDYNFFQFMLNAQARDTEGKIRTDDEPAEARGQCRAVLSESLHIAVEYSDRQAVQQLLEAGADANALYESRTPLSRVCFAMTSDGWGNRLDRCLEISRALVAHSARVDVDDAVYDAFSEERWYRPRRIPADFAVEILLVLQGLEGKVDLRDTAAVVSRLIANRSRRRFVALALVPFSKIDFGTQFFGFDPALEDVPLDEEALAAEVEVLCHRRLLEALPFYWCSTYDFFECFSSYNYEDRR